jgi:hypothetical protein
VVEKAVTFTDRIDFENQGPLWDRGRRTGGAAADRAEGP